MKKTLVFLAMIGLAATLSAQSLVGLARIEKARRLSLAGRRAPVITNADLFLVKLRPAVEVVVPEEETTAGLDEGTEAGETATAEVAAPGTQAVAATPPAGETAAAPNATTAPEAGAAEAAPSPEDKLKEVEEMIDLLQTKIAALNQDYSSQANMTPNYVIEQQLTETLKKLQSAQTEATKLRVEIEQKRIERRANPSPVR